MLCPKEWNKIVLQKNILRKNKRGDRGSVEEETSLAKKYNMAESDEENSQLNSSLAVKEPSLLEIKNFSLIKGVARGGPGVPVTAPPLLWETFYCFK